jgi:O-antigen/teichoic acid export membrane protein
MKRAWEGVKAAGGRWYRNRIPLRWQEGARSVGGRSIAEATLWNGAGTVAARGTQVIAMIFAARALGAAKFGALGILLSTVGAVQVFSGLALSGTTTKYVAQFRLGDPARAGRVVAISHVLTVGSGLIFALAIFFGAPFLSVRAMGDAGLVSPLRALSLVVPLSGFVEMQKGALAGVHAFRKIALANLGVGAITFPAILLGARLGGLKGVIWALVSVGVLSCLGMGYALQTQLRASGLRMNFRGMWGELPLLWRFTLPSLLVGATSMPVSWFCQTLLLKRRGYEEVALFIAANQWYGVVSFLPAIFGAVVLPRLSESYGTGDRPQLRRLSSFGVGVNGLIALLFGAFFVAAAPFLMRAYGAAFVHGALVMDLVVACACVTVIQAAFGQGLAAVERMWGVALWNLVWAGTFIAATLAFVNRGAVGLASARLLAQIIGFGGAAWLFHRHVTSRGKSIEGRSAL